MTQTEILMHANARANMVRNNQPGQPRIVFADATSLFLGGSEVRARHYGRGHTNGDAVIYFPALRIVHTGDLFVEGDPFADYANGGSIVDWDHTLDQVLNLDFDLVIPGHGQVKQRADFVAWIDSLRAVRAQIRELSRAGRNPDEAFAALKLEQGWGPRLKRAIDGMLAELQRQ